MERDIQQVKPQLAADQEFLHVDTLSEYYDRDNDFVSPFNNAVRSKAGRLYDSRKPHLKMPLIPVVVPTRVDAELLPAGTAQTSNANMTKFKEKYADMMAYSEYHYMDVSARDDFLHDG